MKARCATTDPLPVLRRCGSFFVMAGFVWSLLLCCIHCSLGGMTERDEAGSCCAAKAASQDPAHDSPCESSSAGCLWKTEFLKSDAATVAPVVTELLVFDLVEHASLLRGARVDARLASGFPPPSSLRPEFSLGRFSRSHSPPRVA